MTLREIAIAKLQQLPESSLHEVNHFIDFLLLKSHREPDRKSQEDIAIAWSNWVEAVEQLEVTHSEASSEYQELLLNKYRQQGLNL